MKTLMMSGRCQKNRQTRAVILTGMSSISRAAVVRLMRAGPQAQYSNIDMCRFFSDSTTAQWTCGFLLPSESGTGSALCSGKALRLTTVRG